jgi:hypothetical protein
VARSGRRGGICWRIDGIGAARSYLLQRGTYI